MTPAYEDRWLTVIGGDCREVLRSLPAESVNCVVTSPPYWGLRDYGLPPAAWGGDAEHEHVWADASWRDPRRGEHEDDPARPKQGTNRGTVGHRGKVREASTCECGAWRGSLGLEPDPFMFVDHLVEVFREIRRVLRPDGTVWLNLGDSFASKTRGSDLGWDKSRLTNPGRLQKAQAAAMRSSGERHRGKSAGLKNKDLVGIPWRVAFALQAEGWWLRRDIVWAKPNPMPESTTDRPTSAHEYVFLLARSERYHYDGDAIREPATHAREAKWDPGTDGLGGADRRTGRSTRRFSKRPAGWNDGDTADDQVGRYKTVRSPHAGGRRQAPEPGEPHAFHPLGRNKRSVWTIATQPYPGAHFATFPLELVRPMVRAGCPERQCPTCGVPWRRQTDVSYVQSPVHGEASRTGRRRDVRRGATSNPQGGAGLPRLDRVAVTTGWEPGCDHLEEPVPGVVLDPFAGAGTVGLVAQQEGRRAVLIDLNPDYLRQCLARTAREFGVGGRVLEDHGGEHPADSLWVGAAG